MARIESGVTGVVSKIDINSLEIDEIKENPKDVLQGTFDDVKEKINEYSKNAITKGDKETRRRK